MASTRSQIAKANRIMLTGQLERKMAGRNVQPTQYRQSKIVPTLFLEDEESILHITGNSHQRCLLIENYQRRFELYIIDTSNARSDTSTFFFNHKSLGSIAAAREEFKKMGFYYLSYCGSGNEVSAFIQNLIPNEMPLRTIDKEINIALVKLYQLQNKDDCLSIFDSVNAQQISSAKTKYDLWLEQWHEPLADDFASVDDENTRRFLQLLQHYAGKNHAEKVLSLHWNRHYRQEVAAVIGQFMADDTLKSPLLFVELSERIAARQAASADDDHQDNNAEGLEVVYMGESAASLNNALIEDILFVLKTAIMKSAVPTIKAHGDLFALLDVVKDMTGTDYSTLEIEVANTSRYALT